MLMSVVVMGVMEHIEEAGVHSGDSACAIPPYSLPGPVVQEIREATGVISISDDILEEFVDDDDDDWQYDEADEFDLSLQTD